MDGEVAGIHAQTKWDGVQFFEFNAAAGRLFEFRDYTLAYPALEGLGGHVPAEQTESEQAERAK